MADCSQDLTPEEDHVIEPDPEIIHSGLSRMITIDGITVDVSIYRLEEDVEWTLEVINDRGTSIAWQETFKTDEDAYRAFQLTVVQEGMQTFLDDADDDNIIEFPAQH